MTDSCTAAIAAALLTLELASLLPSQTPSTAPSTAFAAAAGGQDERHVACDEVEDGLAHQVVTSSCQVQLVVQQLALLLSSCSMQYERMGFVSVKHACHACICMLQVLSTTKSLAQEQHCLTEGVCVQVGS